MHKTPKLLIGGSAEKLEKKRTVTAAELREVMGQSGASWSPWGLNNPNGTPTDPTNP